MWNKVDNNCGLHAIARDWYMEKLGVQNAADNCGTGAGGFKKGNTCARGGQIAEDVQGLVDQLKVPSNASISQFGSTNDYPNTRIITVKGEIDQIASHRQSWLKALQDMGFVVYPSGERSEQSIVLEHPQGHFVGIHRRSVANESALQAFVNYIPKDLQEGYLISRDARDATKLLPFSRGDYYADMDTKDALEHAGAGDLAAARTAHDKAISRLRHYRAPTGRGVKLPKNLDKLVEQAIGLHRIARDWYHERIGDNWQPIGNAADSCGTGKGGFKRGNTCASGKEVATDVGELTKVLGLTGEPQVHLDNNQSMTYRLGGLFNPNKAKAVHDNILRKALGVGFKPTSDSDHGNDLADWRTTTLEHSHGHVVNIVTQTPTRHQEGRVTTYVYYIPKDDREGLALSKEALDTTYKAFKGNPSHHEMEAEAAVEDARMRDHKGARRYHEKMIRAHTEKAGEIQVARATLGKGKVYDVDLVKLHKDAAAAHSIARDWYMERMGVQNGRWQPIGNNCGTGAGGFKKGNTCASGREVGDGTIAGAAAAIGMTKPITFDSSTGNLVTQKFKGSRKALLESLQTLRTNLA